MSTEPEFEPTITLFELIQKKKVKPSRITELLNRVCPRTEHWGYALRKLGPTWLWGKVEREDRVLFSKFYTVWKHGAFTWGFFRPYEPEELTTLLQAAVNTPDDVRDEDIDLLAQHLSKMDLSSPFEPRIEAERQVLVDALASRKGYQTDFFPIEFGWGSGTDTLLGKRERLRLRLKQSS